jgi:hypothetical protein
VVLHSSCVALEQCPRDEILHGKTMLGVRMFQVRRYERGTPSAHLSGAKAPLLSLRQQQHQLAAAALRTDTQVVHEVREMIHRL